MTDQELNEAVAVKLGWKECQCAADVREEHKRYMPSKHRMPDYCHSIEAAFEIVENWTTVGDYQFELHAYGQHSFGAGWANGSGWLARAEADTAPMAIVQAFLKLPEGK